jgi:hypothetical protein
MILLQFGFVLRVEGTKRKQIMGFVCVKRDERKNKIVGGCGSVTNWW